MLDQESLDKITVKDLVDRCGMNCNTFYYYYQDLYTLLEELLQEEADRIIAAHHAFDLWQEGFLDAITLVLEHRRAAYHVFNSNARDYVSGIFCAWGTISSQMWSRSCLPACRYSRRISAFWWIFISTPWWGGNCPQFGHFGFVLFFRGGRFVML